MARTREERQADEIAHKKVRSLEDKALDTENRLNKLNTAIRDAGPGNLDDKNSWDDQQWKEFLTPIVEDILKNVNVAKHDHKDERNGGDCFAKLGANLIDNSVKLDQDGNPIVDPDAPTDENSGGVNDESACA